ncbi:MAG: ribonuclease D [Caulobacterales bacterium]
MELIADTRALADLVRGLRERPFFALDTEFLRETTYWPKLCLIQVAAEGIEALIDPLSPTLDLSPLFEALADPNVMKVFHAARQDIEIFVRLMGNPPTPIFDSQIAAMACGHGDSIAYDALVASVLKRKVDKSSRFSDWSRRPLSPEQLGYALADVTHLRDMYPLLQEELETRNRTDWVAEELGILTAPETYDVTPDNAWMRFKPRKTTAAYLAALKAVAGWREQTAQARDMPRGRILKDEAIYEIADQRPRSIDALTRLRGIPKGWAQSRMGHDLATAMDEALKDPEANAPKFERPAPSKPGVGPIVELLKVLLKQTADDQDVAARLIATVSDLEAIASDDPNSPVLKGWRREVFGDRALALKQGRLALVVKGKRLVAMDIAALSVD